MSVPILEFAGISKSFFGVPALTNVSFDLQEGHVLGLIGQNGAGKTIIYISHILGDEFDAIAAAVLGGTSLFGGRGSVFPGTIVGTILVQMVAAGLVYTQVDLYFQPVVTAAIIFLAVFLDSVRNTQLVKLERRNIRVEKAA
ncbi:MAG TPA: ATP-binding cassette domain-containing protein [Roseiflexaceae bacterium]